MAMAPLTTGQEHSADQLQAAKRFWRLHLTQALRTAVVAGQMTHPLAQRVRNVQLLGLALQRGHHAPLERTLAVEKLSFGGRPGPRRLGHGARPQRGGDGSCFRRRKHVRSLFDSLRSVADASTQTARTIADANGESERRCWREASTADLKAWETLADREAVEDTRAPAGEADDEGGRRTTFGMGKGAATNGRCEDCSYGEAKCGPSEADDESWLRGVVPTLSGFHAPLPDVPPLPQVLWADIGSDDQDGLSGWWTDAALDVDAAAGGDPTSAERGDPRGSHGAASASGSAACRGAEAFPATVYSPSPAQGGEVADDGNCGKELQGIAVRSSQRPREGTDDAALAEAWCASAR